MINVLVDTNCFVALLDSSDKWNKTSVDILTELQKYDINLLITDIVLNEAINVICKRLENKGRSAEMKEFLELIEKQYPVDTILWISADIKMYHSKIIMLVADNQGLLNYNDCFLLSYMLQNKIKNIISFDKDFDQINGVNRIDNKFFQLK